MTQESGGGVIRVMVGGSEVIGGSESPCWGPQAPGLRVSGYHQVQEAPGEGWKGPGHQYGGVKGVPGVTAGVSGPQPCQLWRPSGRASWEGSLKWPRGQGKGIQGHCRDLSADPEDTLGSGWRCQTPPVNPKMGVQGGVEKFRRSVW